MAGLRNPSPLALKIFKTAVFVLCLWPCARLAAGAFGVAGFDLGANPVEALIHGTGKWGLNFLLITLAVTPMRRLTGLNWLIRLRRMLGLFAFFYVVLHFLSYGVVDQRLNLSLIAEDIVERPYITVGITALVLLLPLAATSTRGMVRRLGKRWQKLHRLIYPIGILGVWHFYWQVKQDLLEPLLYAGALAVLLGARRIGKTRRRPVAIAASRAGS